MNRASSGALAALGLLAAFAGRFVLLLFVLAVGIAAGGEMFRSIRARGVKPAALVGLVGIFAFLVIAHLRGEKATMLMPAVLAAVLGASFVVMLARRGRSDVVSALSYTVFTVLVVGLLGGYILALRAAGFRLVLVLLLMVAAAELVRGLGRHTLASWPRAAAGAFVGAGAVAIVAAIALHPPFTWTRAVVLAIVVAATVPLGARVVDLIERDVVTHPGVRHPRATVLRSVDGVLVSAPVFYYAFRVLAR